VIGGTGERVRSATELAVSNMRESRVGSQQHEEEQSWQSATRGRAELAVSNMRKSRVGSQQHEGEHGSHKKQMTL
jgi:hypothetical protein